ncbi:MAG: hypothetical protein U9N87_03705 [Planctomycetota bacterium]|nr:hypothetical protein [Planctomycetota bacterium]
MNEKTSAACCAVLVLTFMIGGCGGPTGPPRYEVSGKVTYNGQPVPAGKIMFEPDRSVKNEGPRGIAKIENGQYKTLPDQGAVAGPLVVRIQGYDGICPEGWTGSDFGKPIFRRYDTKVELTPESASIDFDVPVRR